MRVHQVPPAGTQGNNESTSPGVYCLFAQHPSAPDGCGLRRVWGQLPWPTCPPALQLLHQRVSDFHATSVLPPSAQHSQHRSLLETPASYGTQPRRSVIIVPVLELEALHAVLEHGGLLLLGAPHLGQRQRALLLHGKGSVTNNGSAYWSLTITNPLVRGAIPHKQ